MYITFDLLTSKLLQQRLLDYSSNIFGHVVDRICPGALTNYERAENSRAI